MIILDSHIEGAQEFNTSERGKIYRAIIEYVYYNREPDDDLKGASRGFFIAIRPTLDVSKAKAEAGRKGGSAKSKTKANAKQNESKRKADKQANAKQTLSKTQANAKQNVKQNASEEERELFVSNDTNTPIAPISCFTEIIDYLNEKAHRNYRSSSEATQKLIRARLAEGFTVDDFKRVIDNKCASWLDDPKMDDYLRPSTLFCRSKFEAYLNERPIQHTRRKDGGEFDRYRD